MKKRSIIVGILIVLLCAAWAWRYTTLNHVYKNFCAQKELHEIGDVVPFGQDYIGGACIDGYSLRVDQFDIVDFGEYISSSDLVDVDDSNLGLKGSPTKIAKASDKVRKGAGEKVVPDSPDEAVSYIVGKLKDKHVI